MPRFFVRQDRVSNGSISIIGEDAHHIARSLRMAAGDEITVCDMQGNEYTCKITSFDDDKEVVAEILSQKKSENEPTVFITLYQALPKGDKLDTIIQKAVECGASRIVPFQSERCVVKIKNDAEDKKRERRQRISAEAAKQCGRGIIPKVLPHMRYADAVRAAYGSTFLCYEDEKSYSLKEYLHDFAEKGEKTLGFFVGPEGGYAKEEVLLASERGIPSAKLGNRILRSETASGFVLSCIAYALEL